MIAKRSVFALAKALEGIPILGALSNSPASRAGLRYGDILLVVNGVRTRNVGEYLEAKGLRQDGMHVVVFRSGSEEVRELTFEAGGNPPDPASILAELVTLRLSGDMAPDEGGEAS